MKRASSLAFLKATTVGALLGASLLFATETARAQDDEPVEPTYGVLTLGLHLEGGLGIYQVFGGTGMVPGVYPRAALEYELTSMFSIPVVGRFKTSLDEGAPDLSEVTVSAGLLVRFRKKDFPIAAAIGAGARFGYFSARPELVGLSAAEDPSALEVNGFPITPEATLKFEVWLWKILVGKVGASYAPIFIGGGVLHSVEESLAVALVL